ncbi:hypothetical protein X798_00761 [Onchocerca flexuosa]|uniref:Uncharacterized protein n=1 Tax=Onchocerca flexuosa TaxID=387005 RepID=A0A238C5F1_9BILA|nr:hypothetical protein X798_00761 [Onchocerca flexuosa]
MSHTPISDIFKKKNILSEENAYYQSFHLSIQQTPSFLYGVHNPSPYLRRYRLPTINSNATVAAYDELLSPVDNCAKLAFISALNFQNKITPSINAEIVDHYKDQFCISKPTIPPSTVMPNNDSTELNSEKANSTRTSAISYIDTTTTTDRGNSLNKAAVDFEFRFVATELEKKCHEYDRIASMTTAKAANGTNKNE